MHIYTINILLCCSLCIYVCCSYISYSLERMGGLCIFCVYKIYCTCLSIISASLCLFTLLSAMVSLLEGGHVIREERERAAFPVICLLPLPLLHSASHVPASPHSSLSLPFFSTLQPVPHILSSLSPPLASLKSSFCLPSLLLLSGLLQKHFL